MAVRRLSAKDLERIRHLLPSTLGVVQTVWLDQQSELFSLEPPSDALIRLYRGRRPVMFKANFVADSPPLRLPNAEVGRHLSAWSFPSVTELAAAMTKGWWHGDFYVSADALEQHEKEIALRPAMEITKTIVRSLEQSSGFLHMALENGGEVLCFSPDLEASVRDAVGLPAGH